MIESLDDIQSKRAIDWRINLAIIVALMVLVIITFGRVGSLGFVNYDDPDYVTNNMVVQRGLSWDGVHWAFTSLQASNWHPITWLSHMADCSLFGTNPRGHHWMNVGLHGINAALLFLLLATMTRSLWPSAAAAALFAVHPLRVESVAWISERKDVLSTMFGLLAMLAYVRWVRVRSIAQYSAMLVLFGLSLMSKPMLVTLPFVLLLLDFWPLRRFGSHEQYGRNATWLMLEKLPLLAMSVASSAITVVAQSRSGAMSDLEATPLPLRLTNAAVTAITYLWQMVWPTPLAVLYPLRTDLSFALILVCFVLLAAITAVALLYRRTRPYLLMGWLWYLGTLVPVIGLVQVGLQAHADRYTYVPLIGIVVAVVWTVASLVRDSKSMNMRISAVAVFAAIMLALSLRTHDQLRYWRDSVVLFEHSIAVAGGTAVSCNNLGSALVDQERYDEAIVWLERALLLNPDHAPAHGNLGMAYANGGREDLAEQSFVNALEIDPRNAKANYNLGVFRQRQDRLSEAETLYRTALEVIPDYYEARVNLANVLIKTDRVEEGQAMLKDAARSHPRSTLVRIALGQSLLDHGQAQAAVDQFNEAVALDPANAAALRGLGSAMLRLGQAAQAVPHLLKATEIEPADSGGHNTLGLAFAQSGRFADAEAAFREAVRLRPESSDTWNNLGKALHALNRPDEAIVAFNTAIEHKPDLASAHYHLGNSLLSTNRLDDALASFDQSLQLDPAFIDAGYNRGFTLLRLRRWSDAETAFRAVLVQRPDHRGAQRGLIESLVSTSEATVDALNEALRIAESLNAPPNQREAATLLMLAAAYSRLDRFPEAQRIIDEARTMTTADSPFRQEVDRCFELYRAARPYAPPPVPTS